MAMTLVSSASVQLPLDCGPPLVGFDVGAHYLKANRPWLTLYGLRVRNTSLDQEHNDMAPFQGKVPDELMLTIFSKVDPYTLGVTCCVCRLWRILVSHPLLWQKACLDAFSQSTFEENVRRARFYHKGSWKRMFLERPHLRYNGLYISRNTYLRAGITEWRVKNPVHLVAYFRYLRFYPGGRFLYRTSPEKPSKVLKSMKTSTNAHKRTMSSETSGSLWGKYGAKEEKMCCVTIYPDSQATEFRLRLTLRSTIVGKHDRLDVQSITTRGRDGFEQIVAEALDPEVAENMDEEGVRRHKRGTSPFVFVPWEHIDSSTLNLPVELMDFYVPG